MIKNKRGFSFIEVLVALIILLVGMMGLAVAFQRSINQTNASRNDALAMTLASGIVDDLESRPFSDWPDDASLATVAKSFYSDFQGNLLPSAPDTAYFKPSVTILQDNLNYRDLRITVDWSEQGGLTEMKRAGFLESNAIHTFVMDVSIAQTYGDSIFESGATP